MVAVQTMQEKMRVLSQSELLSLRAYGAAGGLARAADRALQSSQYPRRSGAARLSAALSASSAGGHRLQTVLTAASDLRKSAVDEQFDAGDETRIVGCQEHDCFGDFLRFAKSAHRHHSG